MDVFSVEPCAPLEEGVGDQSTASRVGNDGRVHYPCALQQMPVSEFANNQVLHALIEFPAVFLGDGNVAISSLQHFSTQTAPSLKVYYFFSLSPIPQHGYCLVVEGFNLEGQCPPNLHCCLRFVACCNLLQLLFSCVPVSVALCLYCCACVFCLRLYMSACFLRLWKSCWGIDLCWCHPDDMFPEIMWRCLCNTLCTVSLLPIRIWHTP